MAELTCIVCDNNFIGRADKKTCSAKCRKSLQRDNMPANRRYSPTARREEDEIYDLAARLGQQYYETRPQDRLEFVEELIQRVLAGDNKLRKALTSPNIVRPSRRRGDINLALFHRRDHMSYRTIAEIVRSYCWKSRWNANHLDVLKGDVIDPCSQDGWVNWDVINSTDEIDIPFFKRSEINEIEEEVLELCA